MNGRRTVERPRDGERGAATLWAAGAIAAVCALTVLVVSFTAATATRHRVTAAADLGALAAAARAPDGERRACAAAGWVVRHMRAELVRCRLDGWIASTEVSAPVGGALSWTGTVQAHARAGPETST